MFEGRGNRQEINEEEAVKAFMKFRSFPADKQVLAIAFMNGMEFQKSLYEAGEPIVKEGVAR